MNPLRGPLILLKRIRRIRVLASSIAFVAILAPSHGIDFDEGFIETIILPDIPSAPPGRVRVGTPELTFTSDNIAHVLCPYHEGIRYFRHAPTETTFTNLTNLPFYSLSCFIGVRGDNEVVCVFADSGGVKMARKVGESWALSLVPTTGYSGGDLSGAIDLLGNVSVVVTERSADPPTRLSLYTWSELGGWTTVTLRNGGDLNFGEFHDIGYDSGNSLHVIYQTGWTMDPDTGLNHLVRQPDGTVHESTIAQRSNHQDMHLSFDGDSNPIALYSGYNSYLTFASYGSGGWTTRQLGEAPSNWPPIQSGGIGVLPDERGDGMMALQRAGGIAHVRPEAQTFSFSALDANTTLAMTRGSLAIDPHGRAAYVFAKDLNSGFTQEEVRIGILRNAGELLPRLSISGSGRPLQLTCSNLLVAGQYRLSSSTNMEDWILHAQFEANSDRYQESLSEPHLGKKFFKLTWLPTTPQTAVESE